MAEIRKFKKADNVLEDRAYRPLRDRQAQRTSYQNQIRRHQRIRFYRFAGIALVVALLVFLIVRHNRTKTYEGYEVLSTKTLSGVSSTSQIRLGDNILTYSKDGANCIDQQGEMLWNQTYDMQNPILATSGNVVAIGDRGGRSVTVQNEDKILGHFSTPMPIQALSVSQNGNVALTMTDADATKLHVYTANGDPLYEGKATMQGSGYPAALSLSPNGELMAVSYIQPDEAAKSVKCHVAFYNLGDVGDNHAANDRLVSAYNYSDAIIPYVFFLGNATAVALSDNRLMFYQGAQIPVSIKEYLIQDREILSVYHSDKVVGLIFYGGSIAQADEEAAGTYTMEIYSGTSKEPIRIYFDLAYTDVFFEENQVVIYNENECAIYTMDGVLKYQGTYEKTIRLLSPGGSAYRYLVVTPDSMDVIQLR